MKGWLRIVIKTLSNVSDAAVTRLFGYDMFISHTRDGKPYAVALHNALYKAGQRCFLDQTDLYAGIALQREVANALQRSALLVVVVSEQARAAPVGTPFPVNASRSSRLTPRNHADSWNAASHAWWNCTPCPSSPTGRVRRTRAIAARSGSMQPTMKSACGSARAGASEAATCPTRFTERAYPAESWRPPGASRASYPTGRTLTISTPKVRRGPS